MDTDICEIQKQILLFAKRLFCILKNIKNDQMIEPEKDILLDLSLELSQNIKIETENLVAITNNNKFC